MYIPKSKWVKGTLEQGKSLFLLQGKQLGEQFIGSFIKTVTGTLLSGDKVDGENKEVVMVDEGSQPGDIYYPSHLPLSEQPNYIDEVQQGIGIKSDKPLPTKEDINIGFFLRYFVLDKRTLQYKEVNLPTFKESKRHNIYKSAEIEWVLTGPLDDTYYDNHPHSGVRTLNMKTILQLSKFFGKTVDLSPEEYYQGDPSSIEVRNKKNPTEYIIDSVDRSKLNLPKPTKKIIPQKPEEVPSKEKVLERINTPYTLSKKLINPVRKYIRDTETGKYFEIK